MPGAGCSALLGLVACFFYGYALYSIQGQYTRIYPLCLAILSLSLFGLVYGQDPAMIAIFTVLTFISAVLGVWLLRWLGRLRQAG